MAARRGATARGPEGESAAAVGLQRDVAWRAAEMVKFPGVPGPAVGPVVALQRSKMEWLIGSSEVDLSPAERAISQLSEDKDAIEEKLKALQEESAKQQYVLHYSML